jgi:multidrug efflux pump subunit AcrB
VRTVAITVSLTHLTEAFVLVFIVVLVFLQDWRATLLPMSLVLSSVFIPSAFMAGISGRHGRFLSVNLLDILRSSVELNRNNGRNEEVRQRPRIPVR